MFQTSYLGKNSMFSGNCAASVFSPAFWMSCQCQASSIARQWTFNNEINDTFSLFSRIFLSQGCKPLHLYSSKLLTPTWPLCKNKLSVDYERSISFRKCNRWNSFEIVHVCLNNNTRYNFNSMTMLDSDVLVEGWASIACDPKVAGSSLNRFLFQL